MKRRTIFLMVGLLFVSIGMRAQDVEITLIRSQENQFKAGLGAPESFLEIIHPDLTTTHIELEAMQNGKNSGSNSIKVAEQVKKLLDQGFSIQSCSTAAGPAVFYTTMILTRPRKN